MIKLPFSFRDIEEGTVPQGPNFRSAKEVALDLSGTQINVRVPKHNPHDRQYTEAIHRKGFCDLYNSKLYQPNCDIGSWKGGTVLGRSIGFYGPFLTGIIAELSFDIMVYRRKFTKSTETLFNPEIFEREILNLQTLKYSEQKSYGTSDWYAPYAWGPIDKYDIFAVKYDVKRVIGIGNYRTELAFPLTDDCMAMVYFDYRRLMGGGLEKLDRFIDRKPMIELANNILDSLQVRFSSQAMELYARAKAENPDAQLSTTVERLKWTTPKEDAIYADYLQNPQNY